MHTHYWAPAHLFTWAICQRMGAPSLQSPSRLVSNRNFVVLNVSTLASKGLGLLLWTLSKFWLWRVLGCFVLALENGW